MLEPIKYDAIDINNMHDLIAAMPDHLNEGRQITLNSVIDINTKDIQNILVLGMGGSAIGGEIAGCYLEDELSVPIYTNRKYSIPAYANENTLVIVSSYSGNTEETLSSLEQAIEKKCQIIGISSNGKVEEISESNNFPLVKIPGGLPPRAAFGYSFSVLLTVLEKLGFCSDKTSDFDETTELLRNNLALYGKEGDVAKNTTKYIAARLYRKLPIIYTSTKVWNGIGVRFKGQICENAKVLAYNSPIPEMNHNELVGWEVVEHLCGVLKPIFIFDKDIHPNVRFRMNFVLDKVQEMGIDPIIIESEGNSLMTRVFSIIQIADFISYYLAIINNVDPTPVNIIEDLKFQLSNFGK